jgi:hypothetical protein
MSPRVFSEVLALCLATVVVVTLGLLTKSLNAASVYGEYPYSAFFNPSCFYFPCVLRISFTRATRSCAPLSLQRRLILCPLDLPVFLQNQNFSNSKQVFPLSQLLVPSRRNFCSNPSMKTRWKTFPLNADVVVSLTTGNISLSAEAPRYFIFCVLHRAK